MRAYRARKKREQTAGDSGTITFQEPADPAAALVAWAADTLTVPDGLLAGQPFRIEPWQAAFIRDALAPGIRESGLSVARKNGKSALISSLLLGYLGGPLTRPGWRGLVTSMTGELAKELRDAMETMGHAAALPIKVLRSPTPGRIEGPQRTRVDFLAADKSTGHSRGADLVIVDEAGLLGENRRELWNAMLSSTSARNGRMIAISIQADGEMFAELRDRRDESKVAFHLHAPVADCDLEDREAWHAGNPGLGTIKSLSYMEDMASRAKANPADAPTFRAYDLNLPQSPGREMICTPTEWDENVTYDPPDRDGEVCLGVDLGGSSSMTACVGIWPRTGRMEVWAAFGDKPSLDERGSADGVGGLYRQMEITGQLLTFPGRVTPVHDFLAHVSDAIEGERVVSCGMDRYRRADAEQALSNAGLTWPLVLRGQGASATADGSHDVRAFQRLIYSQGIKAMPTLLMENAIAESALIRDALGNPAIDKSRQRGRIDVLSAGVIAAGLAAIVNAKPRRKYRSVSV